MDGKEDRQVSLQDRANDYNNYVDFCKKNNFTYGDIGADFLHHWSILRLVVQNREEQAEMTQQKPNAEGAQVGGTHYGKFGEFQHWDVVAHFNLNYFEGQITRYVFRCREKGGIEDLRKARHYIDKYIAVLAKDTDTDSGIPRGKGYVDQD